MTTHGEPISTVTLRTLRAGLEAEFEAALKEFFHRSRSVPGQLAVHVDRSGNGCAWQARPRQR